MCCIFAAWFTIWSIASKLKLIVISSTIGLIPPIAAPIAAPTMPEFGDRRIDHPLAAIFLLEAAGDDIGAAIRADILTKHYHAFVAVHLLGDGFAESVAIAQFTSGLGADGCRCRGYICYQGALLRGVDATVTQFDRTLTAPYGVASDSASGVFPPNCSIAPGE